MAKRRKKLGVWAIISIVFSCVLAALSLALIITNFFIPVKYLSSYCVSADKNTAGQLRISFIDVGYGDCTLAEFPDGANMLIDGGNGEYSTNARVLRALNQRGVSKIDYLVCTSVSGIRCGGLAEVLKYKKADKIYAPYCPITYINDSYKNFAEEVHVSGKQTEILEYGAAIYNDTYGYAFCVLSPSEHNNPQGETEIFLNDPTLENMNNASAVIWIEYQGVGFLLLGDTGAEVQQKIIGNFEYGFEMNGRFINLSSCAVLKIPAHGSQNSVNGGIYQLASPRYCVLSVGDNGMNNPSVVSLAEAQNAVGENLFRTDYDGTVTATVQGGVLTVVKEKV